MSVLKTMSEQNLCDLFPWIDADFVQKVVENCEQSKNVSLKSFNAKLAFKNGENFSSHMVSLIAYFINKTERVEKRKGFLMKIAIQTNDFANVCQVCHIYEREIEAYTKILPAIEKCFDSIGIMFCIAPRCFMADIERRMLVFEDLREQQFQIEDKFSGLNVEYMKLTLSTLAKWHAGTATLLLTKPELFEWYKKSVDYRNAPLLNGFYTNIAKTVSNAVKTWPGFENIANKLINIPQSVHDSMYEVYRPRKGAFNVITHGDMFMNNILFRTDTNEKPIDIRFVDFPLGKHTCPSIDLVCLLYGSSCPSITQADREHLIKYYHLELTKFLKELNFPGNFPTLLDIQSAVFKVDFYNALIVLFILGLRFLNQSFDGGFLEVLTDDGCNKLYSDPRCIEQLKYLLNLFDRRGYFDY